MELRHLRYFVAVAETLHFARAAKRIGMEQSPLSRAIRELEAELGCELLLRTRQRTRLTGLGEQFLVDARRILLQIKQSRTNLQAAMGGRFERLRIGVSPAIADYTLSRTLARLRRENLRVGISLRELSADAQLSELRNGDIELGLSPVNIESQDFCSHALWEVPLVLMVPIDHPWAAASGLSPQDLAQECAIAAHSDVMLACRGSGIPLQITESVHLSLLIEEVAAGMAIGLAGAHQLIGIQRPDIAVLAADRCPLALTVYVHWYTANSESGIRRFLECAQLSCRTGG